MPPPSVDGKSGGGSPYDQYFQNQQNLQFRQLPPGGQTPGGQAPGTPIKSPAAPAPGVKLERIALADEPGVQGQVVSDARAPKAGVKLTFVSANNQAADQTVTADAAGRFDVQLPAGQWLVYVRTADGQQVYHSRIEVGGKQTSPFVLVSR